MAACTTGQQDALSTMVAAVPPQNNGVAMQPTLSVGEMSTLVRPTPLPTMAGPMGTLTAIAPMLASPTYSGTPYQVVYADKPVLIDFNAWWCEPCNAMRPFMKDIEETYQGQIDFYSLNIDEPASAPLANQYRVSGIPLIVLLRPDGTVFRRLEGYQPEDMLIADIKDLLDASGS